jgi:hypothetical protein
MKLQEMLVFGSLIIIVGMLFYTSGSNLSNLDELPSEFDGKNVIYPAGDTFVLTFNAKSTSDRETLINSESEKYPYSESWIDIGNGRYDKGEEFTDTRNSKNGKWDRGEKYNDIPDGEYTPCDIDGNPFERFTDSDLNGVWTRDLLEFKWEKVTWKDSWKEQATPLSAKSVSEPWMLEYEGSDQGRIQIRLTVIDYRSTNRNEKGIVMSEKEWNFNCERLLEKAPKIETKKVELSYNYNY